MLTPGQLFDGAPQRPLRQAVVAFDLGTKTGVAIRWDGELVHASTTCLASAKELREAKKIDESLRAHDPRAHAAHDLVRGWIEYHDRLNAEAPAGSPVFGCALAWEDVQFSTSTAQTQLWASLRTALWLAARTATRWTRHPIPVGTLKKFATGAGNADKEEMAAALLEKYPGEMSLPRLLDDNAVDAIWLSRLVSEKGISA